MFLYFLKLLLQPFLLVAYNTKQPLSARYPVHPYFGDTSIFYCKWKRVTWEGTYERPDLEGQQCCGQAQQHPKRWVQAHRDMREVWGLQAGFPAELSRSAARSEATRLCFRGDCPLQCILLPIISEATWSGAWPLQIEAQRGVLMQCSHCVGSLLKSLLERPTLTVVPVIVSSKSARSTTANVDNTSISIHTARKIERKQRSYFAGCESGTYSSDVLQNLLFSL